MNASSFCYLYKMTSFATFCVTMHWKYLATYKKWWSWRKVLLSTLEAFPIALSSDRISLPGPEYFSPYCMFRMMSQLPWWPVISFSICREVIGTSSKLSYHCLLLLHQQGFQTFDISLKLYSSSSQNEKPDQQQESVWQTAMAHGDTSTPCVWTMYGLYNGSYVRMKSPADCPEDVSQC